MNNYHEISHPSYNEIHVASIDLAKKAAGAFLVPDVIIGLARGGLLPATIMSHYLDIPLIAISYSSKSGKGDNKHHNNYLPEIDVISKNNPVVFEIKHPTICLIDDIADSGKSLYEVSSYYTQQGHNVYTAVLYYKELSNPLIKPRFYWREIPEDCGWIYFPWETRS